MVISRKLGERVYLDDGKDLIVLTVTEIDRGRVRIGIEAGRHIGIAREEIATAEQHMRYGESKTRKGVQ